MKVLLSDSLLPMMKHFYPVVMWILWMPGSSVNGLVIWEIMKIICYDLGSHQSSSL